VPHIGHIVASEIGRLREAFLSSAPSREDSPTSRSNSFEVSIGADEGPPFSEFVHPIPCWTARARDG